VDLPDLDGKNDLTPPKEYDQTFAFPSLRVATARRLDNVGHDWASIARYQFQEDE
jgi:hypothetical protein